MKIDYLAIKARMEQRQAISDAYSGELHPWEVGFNLRNYEKTRTRISRGRARSTQKSKYYKIIEHAYPYRWTLLSPITLFTQLVRFELPVNPGNLHGKECTKCNALRALRCKSRPKLRALQAAQQEQEQEDFEEPEETLRVDFKP